MGRANPRGSLVVAPDIPVPIPPRTSGGSSLPPSPFLVGETPFVNKVSTAVVGSGTGLSRAQLVHLGRTLHTRAAIISSLRCAAGSTSAASRAVDLVLAIFLNVQQIHRKVNYMQVSK